MPRNIDERLAECFAHQSAVDALAVQHRMPVQMSCIFVFACAVVPPAPVE